MCTKSAQEINATLCTSAHTTNKNKKEKKPTNEQLTKRGSKVPPPDLATPPLSLSVALAAPLGSVPLAAPRRQPLARTASRR